MPYIKKKLQVFKIKNSRPDHRYQVTQQPALAARRLVTVPTAVVLHMLALASLSQTILAVAAKVLLPEYLSSLTSCSVFFVLQRQLCNLSVLLLLLPGNLQNLIFPKLQCVEVRNASEEHGEVLTHEYVFCVYRFFV